MKVHKTAQEAIDYSDINGEVAYCEDTPENHARLKDESDDCYDGKDYHFGDPDIDDEVWRVNVIAD